MDGFMSLHPSEWFAVRDEDERRARVASPQYGGGGGPAYGQPAISNNVNVNAYNDGAYAADNNNNNTYYHNGNIDNIAYPGHAYPTNFPPDNTYPINPPSSTPTYLPISSADILEVEYGFDGKHVTYSNRSRSPHRPFLTNQESLGTAQCLFVDDGTGTGTGGDVSGWAYDVDVPMPGLGAVTRNVGVHSSSVGVPSCNVDVAPHGMDVVLNGVDVVPNGTDVAPHGSHVAPPNSHVAPPNSHVAPPSIQVAPPNLAIDPYNMSAFASPAKTHKEPGYNISVDLLCCGDSGTVVMDFEDALQPVDNDNAYGQMQSQAAKMLMQMSATHAPPSFNQPAYVNLADVCPPPCTGSPTSPHPDSHSQSGCTSPALSTASPLFSDFSCPSTQTSYASDFVEQKWPASAFPPAVVDSGYASAGPTQAAAALPFVAAAVHSDLNPAPALLSGNQSQRQHNGNRRGPTSRRSTRKQRTTPVRAKKHIPTAQKRTRREMEHDDEEEEEEEARLPAKKSRVSNNSGSAPENIRKRSARGAESLVRRATPVALRHPLLIATDDQTGGHFQSGIHGVTNKGEAKGPRETSSDQGQPTKPTDPRLRCDLCDSKFGRKYDRDRHMNGTLAHGRMVVCPMPGCPDLLARSDERLRHMNARHPDWRAYVSFPLPPPQYVEVRGRARRGGQ